MMIRNYKQHPRVFVPDIGEIIEARRTGSEPFTPAIVTHVRRMKSGQIKLTVIWQGDLPNAGVSGPHPIQSGTRDWVYFWPDNMAVVVKQTTTATPSAD